jgi:hypothetical protein
VTHRRLAAVLLCLAATLGGCAPAMTGDPRPAGSAAPPAPPTPSGSGFGSSAPHDFGSRGP